MKILIRKNVRERGWSWAYPGHHALSKLTWRGGYATEGRCRGGAKLTIRRMFPGKIPEFITVTEETTTP